MDTFDLWAGGLCCRAADNPFRPHAGVCFFESPSGIKSGYSMVEMQFLQIQK